MLLLLRHLLCTKLREAKTNNVNAKEENGMKYIVVLADGMSDYKIPELGNMTPIEKAKKDAI